MRMSDTFKCAYNVFTREIERVGRAVEPKHITTLVFATDKDAFFEFDRDDIVIHFSDGSEITIVHVPATKH
jgi:hypothetical protein